MKPVSEVKLMDCKHNHWTGRKHSEETKIKMRLSKIGDKNPMKVPANAKKLSETLIANKTYVGDKNPRWIGGTKHYRGSGWKDAKEQRRRIDNYECRRCGAKESEFNRKLDVHHVLSYKKGGANDIDNLITVCRSCHNKLRKND